MANRVTTRSQYSRARVFMYSMHFAPRVSAAVAYRLMKREVPPDARQVKRVRKATCEQAVYRSAMLKRATGSGTVGIELSATGSGGRYRGVVGDAIVGPISTDLGC